MTLKPLGDRVLVKRIPETEQTPGGLYIPPAAQEKNSRGEVVAVGPGGKFKPDGSIIPMTVKVGDTVLFGKYGGNEIKVDDDELLILREDEILAVVEE